MITRYEPLKKFAQRHCSDKFIDHSCNEQYKSAPEIFLSQWHFNPWENPLRFPSQHLDKNDIINEEFLLNNSLWVHSSVSDTNIRKEVKIDIRCFLSKVAFEESLSELLLSRCNIHESTGKNRKIIKIVRMATILSSFYRQMSPVIIINNEMLVPRGIRLLSEKGGITKPDLLW